MEQLIPPHPPHGIRLRALEPEDVDILYAWENDPDNWRVGAVVAPYSRQQILDYINTYQGDIFSSHQLRLMITDDNNAPLGCIDLYHIDWLNSRGAVGILVEEDARSQSVGTTALNLLTRYCHKHLGLCQLYCVIGTKNEASKALFRKAGFTETGILRNWMRRGAHYEDAILCQKIMIEPSKP